MTTPSCSNPPPASQVDTASAQSVAGEPPVSPDLRDFAQRVERELGQCRRFGQGLSVLLIKPLPAQCDRHALHARMPPSPWLARALVQRLRGKVRSTDLVVQVRDTGAGLVLRSVGPHELMLVRARLQRVLAEPFCVGDERLWVSVQMGGASRTALKGSPSATEMVLAADDDLHGL